MVKMCLGTGLGVGLLISKTFADMLPWELPHIGPVLAVDVLAVRILCTCFADLILKFRSGANMVETGKTCQLDLVITRPREDEEKIESSSDLKLRSSLGLFM
jgi:hypothetical protein